MINEQRNNIIIDKSFLFATRIVKLSQFLVKDKKETVLSNQILRSGSSIGANIEEAVASISKAEFSSKISIAYKEAKETSYWLRLLFSTEYLDKKLFDSLFKDCDELCKILFAILKSSGRIR